MIHSKIINIQSSPKAGSLTYSDRGKQGGSHSLFTGIPSPTQYPESSVTKYPGKRVVRKTRSTGHLEVTHLTLNNTYSVSYSRTISPPKLYLKPLSTKKYSSVNEGDHKRRLPPDVWGDTVGTAKVTPNRSLENRHSTYQEGPVRRSCNRDNCKTRRFNNAPRQDT